MGVQKQQTLQDSLLKGKQSGQKNIMYTYATCKRMFIVSNNADIGTNLIGATLNTSDLKGGYIHV